MFNNTTRATFLPVELIEEIIDVLNCKATLAALCLCCAHIRRRSLPKLYRDVRFAGYLPGNGCATFALTMTTSPNLLTLVHSLSIEQDHSGGWLESEPSLPLVLDALVNLTELSFSGGSIPSSFPAAALKDKRILTLTVARGTLFEKQELLLDFLYAFPHLKCLALPASFCMQWDVNNLLSSISPGYFTHLETLAILPGEYFAWDSPEVYLYALLIMLPHSSRLKKLSYPLYPDSPSVQMVPAYNLFADRSPGLEELELVYFPQDTRQTLPMIPTIHGRSLKRVTLFLNFLSPRFTSYMQHEPQVSDVLEWATRTFSGGEGIECTVEDVTIQIGLGYLISWQPECGLGGDAEWDALDTALTELAEKTLKNVTVAFVDERLRIPTPVTYAEVLAVTSIQWDASLLESSVGRITRLLSGCRDKGILQVYSDDISSSCKDLE